MKFIKHIRKQLGLTRYALAKELNIASQSIDHLEAKGIAMKLDSLCKLRKVSGLSWSKFGEMLDKEFL